MEVRWVCRVVVAVTYSWLGLVAVVTVSHCCARTCMTSQASRSSTWTTRAASSEACPAVKEAVDVVTDCGTVRRRVVGAEDVEHVAIACRDLQRDRDKVRLD